jgi:septum formation protein
MRETDASASDLAETLAELKARKISGRHGGALVVGADQVLDCQGKWFDKPVDRAAARAQLLDLRGKMHELISCVCVLRDGERLWHHIGRARLTVRPFTESFLDDYLDQVGDAVLQSVGAYQLEGRGAQLFSRIDGDYFTILGLPLLPLLDFLRNHGVVRS